MRDFGEKETRWVLLLSLLQDVNFWDYLDWCGVPPYNIKYHYKLSAESADSVSKFVHVHVFFARSSWASRVLLRQCTCFWIVYLLIQTFQLNECIKTGFILFYCEPLYQMMPSRLQKSNPCSNTLIAWKDLSKRFAFVGQKWSTYSTNECCVCRDLFIFHFLLSPPD